MKNQNTIYLAMARGILMGKADQYNIDALLPEIIDWESAADDPKTVRKLAKILKEHNKPLPPLPKPKSPQNDLSSCCCDYTNHCPVHGSRKNYKEDKDSYINQP